MRLSTCPVPPAKFHRIRKAVGKSEQWLSSASHSGGVVWHSAPAYSQLLTVEFHVHARTCIHRSIHKSTWEAWSVLTQVADTDNGKRC